MSEDKLKQYLLKAKKTIISGLDRNLDNPDVFKKFDWLKNQYNRLIILEDKIKDPIRELNEGIAGNNIHFSYTDGFYNKRN